MDENDLTTEQMQDLWNEEAAKLDADETSASEPTEAAAPQDEGSAPQEEIQETPAAPEPQDPYAGLPDAARQKLAQVDELIQANAQLLQHVRSAEGRVAAMQREFQQARQAATQVSAQDAPSQGQMAAAAKNPEKWEQLKEDFPEWASAMEEYVAAKIGAVQQRGGLTPEVVEGYVQQQVAQTREEMTRLVEEARLEGKYENWRDTVKTPEFAAWYSVQSPETKALAGSPRARDAIAMLDLYEKARVRPASEVRQERNQRLAAAATTRPGQTPPPKTLDDMSAEELWNYEARRRDKERAERGY